MPVLSSLFSIIYPETCLSCSDTLISAENFICTACKQDLPETKDYHHATNPLFQKFAYEPLVKSASAFMYFTKGGVSQKLLHHLKYNGRHEIGRMTGEWFGRSLFEAIDVDVIIPVPIHKTKQRQRGYNQSLHFALGLSDSIKDSIVREDLVFRIRKTASQTKKKKVQRWQNLDNVYSDVSEDLTGLSLLIVDDVITTGATIGMLCDKLKVANPKEIHIACMARG